VKRSIQPPFWLLFGAGGMLSALLGWGLVLATGIAAPLGLVDWMRPASVRAFVAHPLGGAFAFAVVALFLWHGAHRIFHSLHGLGVHAKAGAMLACYGLAFLGTAGAAAAVLLVAAR
jgi:fumarate reductase subunit D